MKAVGMEPQVLIDILVGSKIGVVYPFGTDHRGDLVVTSYALKQAGLPSNMAGAVVQLEDVEETAPGNFVWKFNPDVKSSSTSNNSAFTERWNCSTLKMT